MARDEPEFAGDLPELSGQAQSLLQAYRDETPPPDRATREQDRLRAALVAAARTPTRRSRSWFETIGLACMGAAATGLLAYWLSPRLGSSAAHRASEQANMQRVGSDSTHTTSTPRMKPRVAPATVGEGAGLVEPRIVDTSSGAGAASVPQPATRLSTPKSERHRTSDRRAKPRSSNTSASPDATSPKTLQLEVALVQRMRDAMQAQRYDVLLELADQHERTFPAGVMIEEREAWKTLATCLRGDHRAGGPQARTFLQRFPRSTRAHAIRRACGLDEP